MRASQSVSAASMVFPDLGLIFLVKFPLDVAELRNFASLGIFLGFRVFRFFVHILL